MYHNTSTCRGGLAFPIVPLIGPLIGAVGGLFGGGSSKAPKVSRSDARAFVRSQYNELFCREPDPNARGYEDCLVAGDCTAEKVRSNLMSSVEYADKQSRGVCTNLPPAPTGSIPTGALPDGGPVDVPGSTGRGGASVFDSLLEYWPYVAGGVVLLMVLKK